MDAKKERETKLIEAGKEGITALGRIGQGVMSNQVAGTILTVLGLYATYPAWIGTLQTATGAIVKSAADAWKNGILPGVGRDDANGLYGVGITSDDQLNYVMIEWWDTPAERDAALAILSVTNPLHAERVDRTGSAATGFNVPATAYARAHPPPHGKWAIIWNGDQFTTGPVVVGYYDDYAQAVAQSNSYNQIYGRDSFVQAA